MWPSKALWIGLLILFRHVDETALSANPVLCSPPEKEIPAAMKETGSRAADVYILAGRGYTIERTQEGRKNDEND